LAKLRKSCSVLDTFVKALPPELGDLPLQAAISIAAPPGHVPCSYPAIPDERAEYDEF
jgi:hypothetical protein